MEAEEFNKPFEKIPDNIESPVVEDEPPVKLNTKDFETSLSPNLQNLLQPKWHESRAKTRPASSTIFATNKSK